jgi:hypothetical protein
LAGPGAGGEAVLAGTKRACRGIDLLDASGLEYCLSGSDVGSDFDLGVLAGGYKSLQVPRVAKLSVVRDQIGRLRRHKAGLHPR